MEAISQPSIWPPEDYAKFFHPKSRGHQAIKEAVLESVRARGTVRRVLIMYRGSQANFQTFVALLPKSISTSRMIQQPDIDLRAYSTWLTDDQVREVKTDPNVVGVSYEISPDYDEKVDEGAGALVADASSLCRPIRPAGLCLTLRSAWVRALIRML